MKSAAGTTGSRFTGQIRRAIIAGRWAPGERVPPATVAAQYGLSPTVVREALTRLEGEGLVVSRPNQGFFVAELSLRELEDLTLLRCASESVAVRLSLARGDLEWEAALIASHHRLQRTPRRSDEDAGEISAGWEAAHREFHRLLIAACACEPMTSLSANLAVKTELYRRWAAPTHSARSRDVEREHSEILAAAVARDADAVSRLLTMHYETTVRVVLEAGLKVSP